MDNIEELKETVAVSIENINTENANDLVGSNVDSKEKGKRGRKKKVVSTEETQEQNNDDPFAKFFEPNSKLVEAISEKYPTDSSCVGIGCSYKNIYNSDGLVKNLEYKYDSYGFIDWRAMINPKHIVLNRNSLAKAGIPYESLSDADREKYLNEWPDDKKIIRLAGFKEVARLRGYQSITNKVEQVGDKVICHCTIEWKPNFEGYFSYTAAASASPANVAPEYSQALEAIACNRAFARAVRESLNIHVVSDEELDPNKVEEVSNSKIPSTHPRAQLIKKCTDMGVEFPAVKTMLAGLGLDNVDIISFDTVPGPTAMAILDEMRKQ